MLASTALALLLAAKAPTVEGIWLKDLDASTKVEGEAQPRKLTVIVTTDTRTRIVYRQELVDANGQLHVTRFDGRYDGSPYKLEGDPDNTRIAFTRINERRFKEVISSDSSPTMTVVCSLQASGDVEICTSNDPKGKHVSEVYRRVP